MSDGVTRSGDRLYQDLARQLIAQLAGGQYPVGSRLPAERELAMQFNVSRPTVREAIIALEVQGLVDVRIGSGAYVLRLPGKDDIPGFDISAFELTEARLLFEGEAAALAATQASETELAEIEALIAEIVRENADPRGTEQADRAFSPRSSAKTPIRAAPSRPIARFTWRLPAPPATPPCSTR